MNLRSIVGLTPETRVRKRSSSLACGRSLRRYSCDVRVARSDPPLQDQNVSIYADDEVSRSWTPVKIRLHGRAGSHTGSAGLFDKTTAPLWPRESPRYSARSGAE